MPVLYAPDAPTHDIPGARFTTLASPSRGAAETSVWRLELLPGAEPVPHLVTREEIFVALEGEAVATLDGVEQRVRVGDVLVLPPGVEFSLTTPGAQPFGALVCQPVGGQAAMPGGELFTPPWAE
jgi:mannose-6-phosphate isomerase-like protein (cupin superfamily)